MKIVVGSDHGGYDLKEALRRRLEEEGHEVQDVWTTPTSPWPSVRW